MGEAKRRQRNDPTYGRRKRGLVISPPLTIEGSSIFIRSTNIDPQELRLSLLFWDRLVWPSSRALHIASGPDEEFLEAAGILARPDYTISGVQAVAIPQGHMAAFIDLDAREPGQWSLAQGENSLLIKNYLLEPDKGAMIELHRAIPIPNQDVPLQEILEFKRRRRDELELLRVEIDTLFAAIQAAEDKDAELAKRIMQIDAACADALRISQEWTFPVRLTNLKASVELRPFVTVAGGLAGLGLGTYALPSSAAILAGVAGAAAASAPALKLSADFGWRGLRPRPGPYRYVSLFHRELF